MEIEPYSYNYVPGNPTSSHTLRVDMQWSPANIAGYINYFTLIGLDSCISYRTIATGDNGSISGEIGPVRSVMHYINFRFNLLCSQPQQIQGQYQIYLDNQLVQSENLDLSCGLSDSLFWSQSITYRPPFMKDFIFDVVGEDICWLNQTGLRFNEPDDCFSTLYYNKNTELVSVTITSGGEYVSFYSLGDAQLIGDSFNGPLSEFEMYVGIIQDEPNLSGSDQLLTLQCIWQGAVFTDQLRIISQETDSIVAESWSGNELNSGEMIYVYVYPVNSGGENCSAVFSSPDVTYNIEIISGNQYGNLIDAFSFNNERVQSITGLQHLNGFSYFIYNADGISPDTLEAVTIRISTSDPNIPHTDFTAYIKPPPIYAYTVPEVLGANEEADVIIKYRDYDGTLYDFPADQTFELAVLDGCVNGNFMVNGEIGVYFADAMQPIKFVTADEIDPEYDKVLLRVGTDLGGYNRPIGGESGEEEQKRAEYESKIIGATGKTLKELREGFEQMITERKAEAEAKEGGEPMFPVVPQCAPNNPVWYLTYYNFLASVRDGCSPLCTKEPPLTNILIKRLYNIYFNPCEDRDKDPTTLELGGFTPLKGKDKWRNPSYFHPCFDGVEQAWRFSMNDIQLYVTVDFCQNYLSRYQVISNISGVDSNEVCNAVKDFKNHEFYPLRVRNGGYMIMELLEKHEEIHERVYLEYMTENKEAFDRILSEFKPTCEEYPNQILAYAGALEKLDWQINSYFTSNYDLWKKEKGWEPYDKVKRKKDEDDTQSHPEVQAIWKNYITFLEILYPSKYKKCK